MNKLDSGVYKIECVENGKVYIGSSIELSKRIYHHKCQLNAGKHHSRHSPTKIALLDKGSRFDY